MGWCTGGFVLPCAIQRSLKVFDPWSLMTFLCFFENLLFNVHCKINPVDIGYVYGTRLQELSFLCFPVWAHKLAMLYFHMGWDLAMQVRCSQT